MKYIELQQNGKGNGQYLPISTFFLNPDQQVMIIGADINEIGHGIQLQDEMEYESVPRGKLSEQNGMMMFNLTAFLVSDGFPFNECPDPAVVIVTRKETVKQVSVKFERRPVPKESNRLPLYQAINEYFTEWFQANPAADRAVIPDLDTFKKILKDRFKVSYSMQGLRKAVEADSFLVPGEGFGFKRSDFFIPQTTEQ